MVRSELRFLFSFNGGIDSLRLGGLFVGVSERNDPCQDESRNRHDKSYDEEELIACMLTCLLYTSDAADEP